MRTEIRLNVLQYVPNIRPRLRHFTPTHFHPKANQAALITATEYLVLTLNLKNSEVPPTFEPISILASTNSAPEVPKTSRF